MLLCVLFLKLRFLLTSLLFFRESKAEINLQIGNSAHISRPQVCSNVSAGRVMGSR